MALSADRLARKQADQLRRRHPLRKPEPQPEPKPAPPPTRRPTQRQLEVLQLVANGYSTREIGGFLYLSEETVKSHVQNLGRIAGVAGINRRAALVAWGFRQGLIA